MWSNTNERFSWEAPIGVTSHIDLFPKKNNPSAQMHLNYKRLNIYKFKKKQQKKNLYIFKNWTFIFWKALHFHLFTLYHHVVLKFGYDGTFWLLIYSFKWYQIVILLEDLHWNKIIVFH